MAKNERMKHSATPQGVANGELDELRPLLGDDPFITPKAVALALGWLLDKFKELQDATNAKIEQEKIAPQYVNQTALGKMFGIDTTTAARFLVPLIEQDRIRIWHPEEANGHPRYNVSDFERAYLKRKPARDDEQE